MTVFQAREQSNLDYGDDNREKKTMVFIDV